MKRQRFDTFTCDVCGESAQVAVKETAGPNDIEFPNGWRQVKLTAPNIASRDRENMLCCSCCTGRVKTALQAPKTPEPNPKTLQSSDFARLGFVWSSADVQWCYTVDGKCLVKTTLPPDADGSELVLFPIKLVWRTYNDSIFVRRIIHSLPALETLLKECIE